MQPRLRRGGTTQKSLSRALSGDLDTITLKALKKTPAERYLTVDALSRDIEHYLRGEPVAARADGTWYRFVKFVGRPQTASGGRVPRPALILVATATIALVEARSAAAERDRALALSARSAAVSEFVKMLVTESGGADQPVSVSDMMARSESLLATEYSQNPEHRAAILAVLGDYYHTIGKGSARRAVIQQRIAVFAKVGRSWSAPGVDLRACHDGRRRRQHQDGGRYAECSARRPGHSPPSRLPVAWSSWPTSTRTAATPPMALKYGKLALERLHQVKNALPSQEALFLGSIGFRLPAQRGE